MRTKSSYVVGLLAAISAVVAFALGCSNIREPAANAQQAVGTVVLDSGALRERINADGEFRIAARYWDARVRLDIGETPFDVTIRNGTVAEIVQPGRGVYDVRLAGPVSTWTDRRALLSYLIPAASGLGDSRLVVEGDRVAHLMPYQSAILRLVGLVGEALGAPAPVTAVPAPDKQFDSAVGRYVYVNIRGTRYRVYYEEAGTGSIPLILQHTAGSDGRQWRHLLEDLEIQKKYRMIAYDMPFHGKSLPPTSDAWWTKEYRMTTELLMETILAVSKALKLERPVYMGCSIGGYLAPDLAYYHPAEFRAVIGINAAIAGGAVLARLRGAPPTQPAPNTYAHPRINNGAIGATMYTITSPTAPEAYRRETEWVYSQGGPGVFAGDLYYYGNDHDLTGGKAEKIDTSQVEVHLLSGEYDPTAQPGPASGQTLADAIKGSTFQIIKGGSHFVMSDDYTTFRKYIVPLLDGIHARHAKRTQTTARR
jgi:pimeloyl-ACP methyl ester carboxylesterase